MNITSTLTMAFIRFTNGRAMSVSAEQGAAIWRILNDEVQGTPEQQRFCSLIRRIYLNPKNAPASYLERYPAPGERRPLQQRLFAGIGNIRLPYKD